MHRKFIAVIIATAVAITGISASKARAADAHDILGGLAAVAILGAAINHYSKKSRHDYVQPVTRHPYPAPSVPRVKPRHVGPIPNRVARYDLPQHCLKTFNRYSKKRPLLGKSCLKKHYKHASHLPRACEVGFWNGKKVKRAYEPACLRQKGYRVVYW